MADDSRLAGKIKSQITRGCINVLGNQAARRCGQRDSQWPFSRMSFRASIRANPSRDQRLPGRLNRDCTTNLQAGRIRPIALSRCSQSSSIGPKSTGCVLMVPILVGTLTNTARTVANGFLVQPSWRALAMPFEQRNGRKAQPPG